MKCPKCKWNLIIAHDPASKQRLIYCPNGACGDYMVVEEIE